MTFASSSVSPVRGLGTRPRHHPAAFVLAFVLVIEHAGLFQLLKCGFPEFQMQNLALAGKKVVFDVEPQHGFKMPAKDCVRYQFG